MQLRIPASRVWSRRSRATRAALLVAFGLFCTAAHAAAERPLREGTRPDEMAELAAASLTVSPELPEPGEKTELRLEVQNRASNATRVDVAFFADGKPVRTLHLSIAAHAAEIVKVPWTAPKTVGVHSITAIVDPGQLLHQRDRRDDVATTEVVVARRPPADADLAVVDVEVVLRPDRPRVLRVTVRNEGKSVASAPLVVRHGGRKVAALLVGPLEPGKPMVVEIPWGHAGPGAPSAEINPRFAKAEHRSGDNVLERGARAPVDLRVEDLSLGAAHIGDHDRRDVTVSFRIVNAGSEPVRGFRTRIEPGVVDAAGARPFFVSTEGLPGSGVAYVSHTIVGAPAQFVLTVTVDVDGAIAETNEENNVATATFRNPTPDVDRWASIGPRRITGSIAQGYGWNEATGRLSAIAIHPTAPATMYVAAHAAGVWKTEDGGATWRPVTDAATVRVAAIALDPTNPSRVILVTPRDGVFRSDDAGTSWIQISTMDLDAVTHGNVLLLHPATPSEMVLASNRGVYRSTDGGASWALTLPGGVASGLVRRPSNPKVLYAAIVHETSSAVAGIYQSVDGGQTWAARQGCPGATLPVNDAGAGIHLAVSGEQLFASYRQGGTWRLFRSMATACAGDVSWEPGWTATGDNAAALWGGTWADPADPRYVYLGGAYVWRSTDNGTSFTLTSGLGGPPNSAHMDHHRIAFDPAAPNVVYTLNDGGIYRSTNRGAAGSWSLFGRDISNVEFYDHGSAPTNSALVIGGTQDNGTIRTDGSTTVWTHIRGGDGATVDFDPGSADVMYSMGQYAPSIARSNDGGKTFTGISAALPPDPDCFNLHYQVHPRSPATLLASCKGLWRTTNSGATWSTILTPAAGRIVRSAIDGPGDVYYAGSTGGAVSRGPSGAGWVSIFTHPGAQPVSDLEVDADDRAVVYASFGGDAARRVYRLVRSATSPVTWAARDITSDLPIGRPVSCLVIDRNRPFTIYAGTDRGVFRGRSVDGGNTWYWVPYANGLPAADVRELDVHPRTGVMRATTFGRSAYEVNTDAPIGSLLAAQGKVTFLRVHDVGTGFGPPEDPIDGEVVAQLDSDPRKSFGFQLRNDAREHDHRGMLDVLRDGFSSNRQVRIEYVRTGLRNGRIIRVVHLP